MDFGRHSNSTKSDAKIITSMALLQNYIQFLNSNFNSTRNLIIIFIIYKLVLGLLMALFFIDFFEWPDYELELLDARSLGYSVADFTLFFKQIQSAKYIYVLYQVIELFLYIPLYLLFYSLLIFKLFKSASYRLCIALLYALLFTAACDILENILLSVITSYANLSLKNGGNSNFEQEEMNAILVLVSGTLTAMKHASFGVMSLVAYVGLIVMYFILPVIKKIL